MNRPNKHLGALAVTAVVAIILATVVVSTRRVSPPAHCRQQAPCGLARPQPVRG